MAEWIDYSVDGNSIEVEQDLQEELLVTTKDKVRPVINTPSSESVFLYEFEIKIPNGLMPFAEDMSIHEGFRNAIGNPLMRCDSEKNTLIIASSQASCEIIANMLKETHFNNIAYRMRLTKSIDDLILKFKKMSSDKISFTEEFHLEQELIKYGIGQYGKHIKKVEEMEGVTHATVDRVTGAVKIITETPEALEKACDLLKLEKRCILIPKKQIGRIIGRNGRMLSELMDNYLLRNIKINRSYNSDRDNAELQLIGSETNLNDAIFLLKYQISHYETIKSPKSFDLDSGTLGLNRIPPF